MGRIDYLEWSDRRRNPNDLATDLALNPTAEMLASSRPNLVDRPPAVLLITLPTKRSRPTGWSSREFPTPRWVTVSSLIERILWTMRRPSSPTNAHTSPGRG